MCSSRRAVRQKVTSKMASMAILCALFPLLSLYYSARKNVSSEQLSFKRTSLLTVLHISRLLQAHKPNLEQANWSSQQPERLIYQDLQGFDSFDNSEGRICGKSSNLFPRHFVAVKQGGECVRLFIIDACFRNHQIMYSEEIQCSNSTILCNYILSCIHLDGRCQRTSYRYQHWRTPDQRPGPLQQQDYMRSQQCCTSVLSCKECYQYSCNCCPRRLTLKYLRKPYNLLFRQGKIT